MNQTDVESSTSHLAGKSQRGGPEVSDSTNDLRLEKRQKVTKWRKACIPVCLVSYHTNEILIDRFT
jgi:hypothetical protein